MIPESRKDDGLILRRPIRENVSLTSLGRFQRFGFVRRGRRAGARSATPSSAVTAPPLARARRPGRCPAATSRSCCSRGRCSSTRACSSPTSRPAASTSARSATSTSVLVRLAADGMAILLISNEVEEILGLAHRVLVMRAGRLVAELAGPDMTEEAIVGAAFGTTTTSAA